MAGSVNKVILIGNLGRDPEIRSTQDGKEIANLSLATTDSWKDKMTGERKDKTEWHRVVIFSEGLVNIVKNYVKKGSKIFVEGALQTRKWTDNTGQERYTTEVVIQNFGGTLTMLDNKNSMGSSDDMGGSSYDSFQNNNGSNSKSSSNSFVNQELDDEIPF